MVTFANPHPYTEVKNVDDVISNWPGHVKKVAKELIHKYGNPHEATPHELIWFYNAPWHKTTLRKDGPYHNFPYSHSDILEQSIQRFVPLERYVDLLRYNGSIQIDRTAGFLTVNCDNEGMNFLTVNLANDIIVGSLSVEDARKKHIHLANAQKFHWPEPYTENITFNEQSFVNTTTAYPDKRSVTPAGQIVRNE